MRYSQLADLFMSEQWSWTGSGSKICDQWYWTDSKIWHGLLVASWTGSKIWHVLLVAFGLTRKFGTAAGGILN
jgi:hypothetical protein